MPDPLRSYTSQDRRRWHRHRRWRERYEGSGGPASILGPLTRVAAFLTLSIAVLAAGAVGVVLASGGSVDLAARTITIPHDSRLQQIPEIGPVRHGAPEPTETAEPVSDTAEDVPDFIPDIAPATTAPTLLEVSDGPVGDE